MSFLCGLCRGKDQCFLLPGLHRTHDAAQGKVDDKIDDAGRAKQHHHTRNVHSTQTIVGACRTQQLTDAG